MYEYVQGAIPRGDVAVRLKITRGEAKEKKEEKEK